MHQNNVQFVAEVSSNHNQDLKRCLAFIDSAASIGCSCVKFQLFQVDQLFSKEVFLAKPEVEVRRNWELPVEFIPRIAEHCQKQRIQFACTPFYLQAVEELDPFVDFFKIASYELLWHDLLRDCAKTGKPIVLSTGMATLEEICSAVQVILDESSQAKITLLHCVSSYPVKPEECNLSAIETLRNEIAKFVTRRKLSSSAKSLDFGWSDHSVSPAVIHRAVNRWNSSMIEFHLDLDSAGAEFNSGHCWLPDDMAKVISHVNEALSADGNGVKAPLPAEFSDRAWRADPSDGIRPLLAKRQELSQEEK